MRRKTKKNFPVRVFKSVPVVVVFTGTGTWYRKYSYKMAKVPLSNGTEQLWVTIWKITGTGTSGFQIGRQATGLAYRKIILSQIPVPEK